MKLFKNIGKRIVACPSCQKKLRVPVKPGKTLRISCSRCNSQFDIKFTSPIMELFQWYPGLSLSHNVKSFFIRLKGLPFSSKIFIALVIGAIISLSANLFVPGKVEPPKELPVQSDAIVI